MGTFNKLKKISKTSPLDEKIEFLNKELKKTGVVCESAPANSTAGIYNVIAHNPGLPQLTSNVPDSTGFADGGTQDVNGGDEGDPSTWDDGWNKNTDMKNPNDLNGTTNRNIPVTADLTSWDGTGSNHTALSDYSSIAWYITTQGIGGGWVIGTLDGDGSFVPILQPNNLNGYYTIPNSQTRYSGWSNYSSYSDGEFAAAVAMSNAFEKYKSLGAVTRKVYVPFSTTQGPSDPGYNDYTGVKKQTLPAGSSVYKDWKLKTINVLSSPNEYISQDFVPSSNTVLSRNNLGDPTYFPGLIKSGLSSYDISDQWDWMLKNAFNLSSSALSFLTQKASGWPSVKETSNKIDDAVLSGLNNLNNILDKVNNNPIADTLNWFGGKKQGDIIGNFVNVAADQVVQHTFGANSSIQYAAQLATKLTASIADGRSHEIKLTGRAKKERINALDLNRLDGNITFGTPNTTVDNAVNPGNKQPFLKGSWGKEGGQEIFYEKDTDTFTILSNKMLRTGAEDQTDVGNPWSQSGDQYDSKGNIIRFGDIPSLSAAELESANNKLDSILNNAPTKVKKIIDSLPNSKWLDDEGTRKYIINSTYDFVVQGSASNVVKFRNWLKNKFDLPDSEMEKTGGGFGHVFSKTSYTGDEIPSNVRAIINKNLNRNESYLSEGWESPKHTYVDKDQQKRWFKEKDVAPIYPKKAPPKMIGGYHPDMLPKLDTPIPQVKVKKKDLIKAHRLKDEEAQKLMDIVDSLNDYIARNPGMLAYARERYPVSDPHLAALNYKMDMQLAAADEYIEKQFPENIRLYNKLVDATKRSIKLTDPKTFKSEKGVFTTFNKLARVRHVDNVYQPKERKLKLKKRGKNSVNRFLSKPKEKTKDDILKDKLAVLDKEMQKTMPDT